MDILTRVQEMKKGNGINKENLESILKGLDEANLNVNEKQELKQEIKNIIGMLEDELERGCIFKGIKFKGLDDIKNYLNLYTMEYQVKSIINNKYEEVFLVNEGGWHEEYKYILWIDKEKGTLHNQRGENIISRMLEDEFFPTMLGLDELVSEYYRLKH